MSCRNNLHTAHAQTWFKKYNHKTYAWTWLKKHETRCLTLACPHIWTSLDVTYFTSEGECIHIRCFNSVQDYLRTGPTKRYETNTFSGLFMFLYLYSVLNHSLSHRWLHLKPFVVEILILLDRNINLSITIYRLWWQL